MAAATGMAAVTQDGAGRPRLVAPRGFPQRLRQPGAGCPIPAARSEAEAGPSAARCPSLGGRRAEGPAASPPFAPWGWAGPGRPPRLSEGRRRWHHVSFPHVLPPASQKAYISPASALPLLKTHPMSPTRHPASPINV